MTTDAGFYRQPISTAEALGLYEPEDQPKSKEDQAADLDYIDRSREDFISNATSPSTVPTFGQSLDRGRDARTMPGATTMTTTAAFSQTFNAAPRVVATIECGRGQDLRVILTSVSTSGFEYKVTAPASSTTTLFVHWMAVQA